MAEYRTADQWKTFFDTEEAAGTILPSQHKIFVDILKQLETLNSNSMCALQQFYFTVTGQTYQSDALIGLTVKNLYYAGSLLIPTTEWTFNSATGTITFVNTITNGISALVQYN